MKSSDTSPFGSSVDSQSVCRGMHFSTEHDNAPSESESRGNPSRDNVYSTDLKGSGYTSERAKMAAVPACLLDSRLRTSEGVDADDGSESGMNAFKECAIREGIFRENAMRGYGSSAMEEKEESVAPWKRELVG